MKQEQILKSAIEKAEKNGYKEGCFHLEYIKAIKEITAVPFKKRDKHVATLASEVFRFSEIERLIPTIIFSHEFAKAFWGERCTVRITEEVDGVEIVKQDFNDGWEHHLQQMVLEEDPILYLANFIKIPCTGG